jgi:hypothetical protein
VCDATCGCIVSVFDQAMRPFFSQENLINELEMGQIGQEKRLYF